MSRLIALARAAALLAIAAGCVLPAWGQSPNAPRYIFQCTTPQGRTLTSDRLIAECNDREQRVFSATGVLIRVVPPSLTADERAVLEAKHERERVLQEAQAENHRRDRQLLLRFQNEKAHTRAREQALESVTVARRTIEKRLELLAEDREPLDREAEFYAGKSLPVNLKRQYDAIEATEAGLRTALDAQAEEHARINEIYDIELERLKRLWAGAAPGSLGPMPAPSSLSARAPKPVAPAKAPEPVPGSSSTPAPSRPKGGGGSGISGGGAAQPSAHALETVSRVHDDRKNATAR
jgi:hypothetical protein